MIAAPSHPAWSTLGAELCDSDLSLAPLPGESCDTRDDRIDTALMSLFRDTGRQDAFEALYRHSRVRVFEWLRWVLREQQARLDPVELLQDTFVNVYRYSSGFRCEHPASFRSWVRTIAANVVRRARATNAQRPQVDSEPHWRDAVDAQPGPHRRASEVEERRHLRTAWLLFLEHYAQAFERLSPRDRRALLLVEVEGCTYSQTSQMLGVGPSNMKMIMLRARRRLVRHMRLAMEQSDAQAELVPARRQRVSA